MSVIFTYYSNKLRNINYKKEQHIRRYFSAISDK